MHPVVKNITALIFTEPHVIPVREPERDLVNSANPALRVDIRHPSAVLQESATPLARSVPEVVHAPRKPERNTNLGTSQRKGASLAYRVGVHPHQATDQLVSIRMLASNEKSTSTDVVMVLADRQTVYRFTTCFQNEGTQRVHLAAWRKLHVLCPLPWPRGNCSIVRGLR